jgi:hypothetical protein
MEQNTVAEQIKTLLTNLREDVAAATEKLDAAKIALRDALASFKPGVVGRPAKVKKARKPKVETPKVEE